jgi:hypothetical protein
MLSTFLNKLYKPVSPITHRRGDFMEEKNILLLSIISVVAIAAMVIMAIVFSANISGLVPKNIGTPPKAITLLTPADGAVVSVTPTLDWTKTHMAEFIVLYVDDERGFSTPLVQDVQLKKNERAFTVPVGMLESGHMYYWRVVAYNAAGASNSATYSFIVQ